jgi:DNA (cytosine-5)-methyltransferase 1
LDVKNAIVYAGATVLMKSKRTSPIRREPVFREWLAHQSLRRSVPVSDVISRLRRVAAFIDLNAQCDVEMLIDDLNHVEQFMELTVTVRSQLRRALRLYKTFMESSEGAT